MEPAFLTASLLSVLAMPAAALAEQAGRRDTCVRTGPNGGGTVVIERLAHDARLTVRLGGVPNGSATSADCVFIAIGAIEGRRFTGNVTRVAVDEPMSPQGDPAPPGLEPLVATVSPRLLTFTAGDVNAYCGGFGLVLEGGFERKS